VAVAIRVLQEEGTIQRAVVIDCDVHQGNGTAYTFRDDCSAFTFSMHGERNFPFAKCDGDLDIALPDGTTDDQYLAALRGAISQLPLAAADCVFYLAGADPYQGDRYGRLNLSKQGLADRDKLVLSACHNLNLPVAVVMAGGYAPKIHDIVDIHFQTVRITLESLGQFGPSSTRSL
jgi:acetoin utilization deacetylase AcuC-like enzyme